MVFSLLVYLCLKHSLGIFSRNFCVEMHKWKLALYVSKTKCLIFQQRLQLNYNLYPPFKLAYQYLD